MHRVIDPTSTEVNRGSFCYLPYIWYAYLYDKKEQVEMHENFTVSDLDKQFDRSWVYDTIYISVWSYSQIDIAFSLKQYLRFKGVSENNIKFFGYNPILHQYSLEPILHIDGESIKRGIRSQWKVFESVKDVLLSDCDMHLKEYEGQVYPLFTSYGCNKGCAFCSASKNTNKARYILPLQETIETLVDYHECGYNNIHFTDEDFFFDVDRAYLILSEAAKLSDNWNFIMLGHARNILKFIDRYGQTIFKKAGVRLLEVGLETASPTLNRTVVKGKSIEDCIELAEQSVVSILWLTMSFFPGETIQTLNQTGEFLGQHGLDPSTMYERIKTNGTEGGLGQFYQPYHGLVDFDKLQEAGELSPFRFMRLSPSFLPNSLMESKVKSINLNRWDDFLYYAAGVYNIYFNYKCLREYLSLKKTGTDFQDILKDSPFAMKADRYILIGILARLGIIK